MKKKILVVALMVALFACVFAISISAEDKIIKLDTLPTLEQIHANPSAYVSHLDALDTNANKEKDSSSVVVLSDLQETPTYYVFPSYYIFSGYQYYPKVNSLNDLIASADATAYASYPASGGRGSNKNIIRVEIPTYVTQLDAYAKFEGSSNIKEIYFPTKLVTDSETGEVKEVTCVTVVSGQNTFSSCSSLEVLHNFEKLPMGVYNPASLSGCSKLTGIKIHDGLTSIPNSMFSGCKSLENIEIPYGVTYIGQGAFYDCDAITEMILPNTVTTIGKKTFASMSSLEVINFGAGLTNLVSSDHNCEIISGCDNIKYIYMPATFATTVQSTGNSILSSGKTATIFFTGSLKDAEALRTKLTASASNALIKNATFVAYDNSINYEGYADTLGYNILVYDYNKCEAFYDGKHNISEPTYELPANYISNAYDKCTCSQCGLTETVKTYAPIITMIGYSAKEDDQKICMSYKLDKEALEKYELETKKTLSFGVTAAAGFDASLEEYAPINSDLSPVGKAIVAPVDREYGSFDFILSGFTAEHYAKALVMCAYVSDGTAITYVDSNCKASASVFTFSQAIA